MCRNITELRGLEPPATTEEIEAAARPICPQGQRLHPSLVGRTPRRSRRPWPKSPRQRRGCWTPCRSAASRPRSIRRCAASRRGDDTATVPALKEWSAVVHALLDGRQRVLLRKGDRREALRRPVARIHVVSDRRAQSRERVRPQFRDLLDAAAPDSNDDRLVVRAAAKVVAALPSTARTTSTRSRICISGRPIRCAATGWTSPEASAGSVGRAGHPVGRADGTTANSRLRRLHQLGACLSPTRRWAPRYTTTRHCARWPHASVK